MLSFFKFLFIRSKKSRFCSVTPIEIEPSPTSDSEYNLSGIIDANKIYVKITNEMTTYSKFNKKIIGKQLYDIQNDIRNYRSLDNEKLEYIRNMNKDDIFLMNHCIKSIDIAMLISSIDSDDSNTIQKCDAVSQM